MKRGSALGLGIAAAVLVAAAALVGWLVGTRSGLEFVWGRLAVRLPEGIEVGAVDGRLLGPLRATNVVLDAAGMHVEIARLEMRWHPSSLLHGTFDIERLALAGVEATQRPAPSAAPAEAPSPTLPESVALPLDVEVRAASVEDLRYFSSADAAPVDVDRVELAATLARERWAVRDLAIAAPRFSAAGRVSLVPSGDYATDAELDWTLHWPEHPDARGKTVVAGNLDRLTIGLTVDDPYGLDARLAVTKLLSAAELDGRIEARPSPAAIGVAAPVETISATATVGGSLSAVDVAGRAVLGAGQLGEAAISIDATYAADALDVRSLEVTEPSAHGRLTLAGKVALAPQIDVALAGDWQSLSWPLVGEPVVESPKGSLRLSGAPEALRADLSATVGAKGGVDGMVRRNGDKLDASLAWHDLAWPAEAPEAESESGKIDVEGTVDDYRFTLEAGLALSSGRTEGRLSAAGSGSLEAVDIERIEAEALRGKLSGHAAVQLRPSLRASVALTADGLDPSVLDSALPGRIDARIEADGGLEDEGASLRVAKLELDGKLRGRAVHLEGAGDYAAGTLRLDGLDAKSGRSELHASGTLADAADLAFSVDSPDLGDLWPGFAGKIAAHGSVKGPRSRPRVAVEAKGGAIRLPRAEIGDLLVDANVDLSGSAASNLALALEDASLAGTSITALKVDGSGNARAHSLTLVADTSVGKADVAVRGSVEAPWQPNAAWSFEVDKATLAYPSLAPWMLDGTATGRWSAGAAELERSCWHSGEARLCIDATDRQGGRHAGLTLTGLPLVYFRPLLSEPVAVEGDLTATAEIDLPKAGPPRIDVTLRTTPGRIGTAPAESSAVALTSSEPAVKESADPAAPSDAAAPAGVDASIFGASARPQGLAFGAADGRIVSDGEKATLDLALPFERQGHVDVHAVVERSPGRPLTASTLQGDAALEVRDLSFLPNVVPEVANTAGRIVGDVMLSGTLSSPRLSGSIALEDARADLIGPGVTVQDVRIVVKGDGSGALAVDAEAESGGGRLTAAGVLRLEGAAPVGEVHVSGERFQLYGTSDATVFVSPDLTLTATPSRLVVGGTVAVPSASITPQVIESGAVTPSPDQVIIGANGEAERRAMTRALYAAITLTLGDDVRFTGYGLTSRLGGRLNIRETPGEPTTASGEVRIEQGTYQAYGQRLEIRRGRLTFAGGPITRPGLDIEAVRQATETILVGARVRGTLAQPELSIFSEPPLPEQEQLAYLVLGRSLEDTSASESSALQSAAIALGLKGGNAVSERLNKNLGFQEFGIETKPGEGTTSASFVIGRYLSPSLYVSYGFGLFQPVNTLTLRYAISSRWRLVTESSSQAKGGDLFYHIERGE